jgi:hypothetical protein
MEIGFENKTNADYISCLCLYHSIVVVGFWEAIKECDGSRDPSQVGEGE